MKYLSKFNESNDIKEVESIYDYVNLVFVNLLEDLERPQQE